MLEKKDLLFSPEELDELQFLLSDEREEKY
jgi:hypothetical protein